MIVFAAVFTWAMPEGSFLHTTLQHEPETHTRAYAFLERLRQERSDLIEDSCVGLPLANIEPESLRIEGEQASFSITYLVGKIIGLSYWVNPRVHFAVNRDFVIPGRRFFGGKSRHAHYKELTIEGLQTYDLYSKEQVGRIPRCLFPAPYNSAIPSNVVLLRLSASLDEELQLLTRYMNGIPPRDSDSFSRMFYLSASTITTSGFGDIVPLTKLSRLAVTGESVIGVLLVGLFLNAVARNKS